MRPQQQSLPQSIREEDGEQTPTLPRRQLTTEQLALLKEVFEKYSSAKTLKRPPRSKLNANGVREIMLSDPEVSVAVSEKELGQLFLEAGMPLHKQTLSHLYAQLATNGIAKGVSFQDISRLFGVEGEGQEEAEEQLFRVYDRRNRGFFDYEDYRFVCHGVALELTEAQIREAFQGIDRNASNCITLADFRLIMKGVH